LLETKNIASQRLGLGEGLGQSVPDDASLVIIGGPSERFLPDEEKALMDYMGRGGRLLLLLDPEGLVATQPFLEFLGLGVEKGLVATERYSVRVIGRDESPYNMATTRFSSHPSVKTLSKASGRLGLVVLGSLGLHELEKAENKSMRIAFPVKSMNDGWQDKNRNGVFDKESESRGAINLVSTLEGRLETHVGTKDARVIVVGDADIAGDGLMRNPGNAYFMFDALHWLIAEEDEGGNIESEEDVALVHRRDEDVLWFYGTSFLIPAGIFAGGLFLTRRRQKRRPDE
jgi:hypothetical protein